jgi:hypothetical protein
MNRMVRFAMVAVAGWSLACGTAGAAGAQPRI